MADANVDWKGDAGQGSDGSAADLAGIVADSVEVLATAAEEHVGLSRRSASLIRSGGYGVTELAADMIEVGGRATRVWRDLARNWVDAARLLMDRRSDQDGPAGTPRGRGAAGPFPDGGPAARRIAVDVNGAEDVAGDAILDTGPALARLKAPPGITLLRPVSGGAPAITGARLGAMDETGALAVIVRVPADQPPGKYSGAIFGDDQLLGSVMVVVGSGGKDAPDAPPAEKRP